MLRLRRYAAHVALAAVIALLGVCLAHAAFAAPLCTRTAPAPGPECIDPTPVCAAILRIGEDTCARRPTSCWLNPDRTEAVAECHRVEAAARRHQAPVALSVVTAYRESGFAPHAESSVGAVGTMQVLWRYVCPGACCDSADAGVIALREWIERYGVRTAVAYYRVGHAALRGVGLAGADSRLAVVRAVKLELQEVSRG